MLELTGNRLFPSLENGMIEYAHIHRCAPKLLLCTLRKGTAFR